MARQTSKTRRKKIAWICPLRSTIRIWRIQLVPFHLCRGALKCQIFSVLLGKFNQRRRCYATRSQYQYRRYFFNFVEANAGQIGVATTGMQFGTRWARASELNGRHSELPEMSIAHNSLCIRVVCGAYDNVNTINTYCPFCRLLMDYMGWCSWYCSITTKANSSINYLINTANTAMHLIHAGERATYCLCWICVSRISATASTTFFFQL